MWPSLTSFLIISFNANCVTKVVEIRLTSIIRCISSGVRSIKPFATPIPALQIQTSTLARSGCPGSRKLLKSSGQNLYHNMCYLRWTRTSSEYHQCQPYHIEPETLFQDSLHSWPNLSVIQAYPFVLHTLPLSFLKHLMQWNAQNHWWKLFTRFCEGFGDGRTDASTGSCNQCNSTAPTIHDQCSMLSFQWLTD